MPGFSIPGLGSAKPNEKLPTANFAPQALVAAATDRPGDVKDGSAHSGTEAEGDAMVIDKDDGPAQQEISAPDMVISSPPDNHLTDMAPKGESHKVLSRGINAEVSQGGLGQTVDATIIPSISVSASKSGPPHVTDALAAALDGLVEHGERAAPQHEAGPETAEEIDARAEWEADSSPYESSASSSDSSDDSPDEESDTEMLGVQEAARLLLETADGSDEEDEDRKKSKGGGPGNQVKSKHEDTEAVPPKPDVVLTDQDPITLLGDLLHIVERSAVIRGDTAGEFRVLDAGSVLCTQDRVVLGVVADVIGNVRHPMYLLRFSQEDEASMASLAPGTSVFYPSKHATFVFTSALRNVKGTDASNFYDEEAGDDELEFSDDEKESAFKRGLKEQRMKRRGGGGREATQRHSHIPRNGGQTGEIPTTLDYDDDDGPYKPLARPANFGQGAPTESPEPSAAGFRRGGGAGGDRGGHRGQRAHRGRGGRGDRGRGDRGRGRGGFSSGYSLPPQMSPPVAVSGSLPTSTPGSLPPPSQWPFSFPPPPPQHLQPPGPPPAAGLSQTNFHPSYQTWQQQPAAHAAAPVLNPGFAYPPPPPTYYGQQPQSQVAANPPSHNGNAPLGWMQGQGEPGWGYNYEPGR